MSRLTELIQEVNESNLGRDRLEAFRDELNRLYGLMCIEMAEKEKEAALFIETCPEGTEAAKKRTWKATTGGQREIELKNYLKIMEKMISSVKSRLYQVYWVPI